MVLPMLDSIGCPRGMVLSWVVIGLILSSLPGPTVGDDSLSSDQWRLIELAQAARVRTIKAVRGSVVAIYGDSRQGGGSGVIFHPSGLALTNHHVIMGAGVSGWGGLADGKLYRWNLIGSDPGGDVAIIRMVGQDEFPFSDIGDSDEVSVGDWALAMGNPFILAEDQTPTVTLGIVSGVKRYQEPAGGNTLEYGNCIQVDSSINPGNSGGPLFNMRGQIIGINGRGSFEDRGRVNVGLGYAISSNQILNFVPDLMATKLVRHGTLDARFGERGGKVVCETIDLDSPIAQKGLKLGDELLAFERQSITAANQFTNLICTLPEGWPAEVTFRKKNGDVQTAWIRLFGLPYTPPPPPKPKQGKEEPTPQQKRQEEKQRAMMKLLASEPGVVRDEAFNEKTARDLLERTITTLRSRKWDPPGEETTGIRFDDQLMLEGDTVGKQSIIVSLDGRFRVEVVDESGEQVYGFDGDHFWKLGADKSGSINASEARGIPYVAQAIMLANIVTGDGLKSFNRVRIDGSDKSQNEVAFRLKATDSDGDWFFVWISSPYDHRHLSPRLLKAGNELNSESGAVLFDRWEEIGGIELPFQRTFVKGIGETPTRTATAQSVSFVKELDTLNLFSSAPASDAP